MRTTFVELLEKRKNLKMFHFAFRRNQQSKMHNLQFRTGFSLILENIAQKGALAEI